MRIWEFFGNLFAPIYKILDWTRQFFGKWWTWLLGIVVLILTPFNFVIGFIISLIAFLNQKIQDLTDIVNSVWNALNDSYPAVANILAIANSILPIDTLFTAMTILISLWIFGLVYRFVKSWIPNTVSGS